LCSQRADPRRPNSSSPANGKAIPVSSPRLNLSPTVESSRASPPTPASTALHEAEDLGSDLRKSCNEAALGADSLLHRRQLVSSSSQVA
jgi:hypothetical protein